MKKNTIAAIGAAALLIAAFALTGCEVPGDKTDPISATETMEGFIADANAENYDDLKGYTHSDAGMHDAANALFWQNMLFASLPLSDLSVSGNTATAVGDGGVGDFSFTLDEDDPEQFKIKTIIMDNTTVFQ